MIDWIHWPKDDKRRLEEFLDSKDPDHNKCFYAARQKEFMVMDKLLYIQNTPAISQDSTPVFVVPMGKWQIAIDGCHCSAGHQG